MPQRISYLTGLDTAQHRHEIVYLHHPLLFASDRKDPNQEGRCESSTRCGVAVREGDVARREIHVACAGFRVFRVWGFIVLWSKAWSLGFEV